MAKRSRCSIGAIGAGCLWLAGADLSGAQSKNNWDPPAAPVVASHDAVARDPKLLAEALEQGRALFRARFNVVDGALRPEATGDSKPTLRQSPKGRTFERIAGPDANSCAGCHNQPFNGGSGDFAANVFVGANLSDPPIRETSSFETNERNTISVFGAGVIETLAREMTEDLVLLRETGLARARDEKSDVPVALVTKGVSFGRIVARPDGTYDARGVEGVDEDLVVKPFGAKGTAVSIREFTNFALNQHHGMQPQERFGWERTGVRDFDGDGVEGELTIGQVSALSLFQARLPSPGRVLPAGAAERERVSLGERRFREVGCAKCHVVALPLRAAWFSEPNPFNRPGTLVPTDVAAEIRVPLDVRPGSGLSVDASGQLEVAAFTDLKRHRICDADDEHFCNERMRQDFIPTDEFLTAKLWDCGTSSPYGHRGDLTTVSEAILHHSGEAREARAAFMRLADPDKASLVLFLLSLQVDKEQPEPIGPQMEMATR